MLIKCSILSSTSLSDKLRETRQANTSDRIENALTIGKRICEASNDISSTLCLESATLHLLGQVVLLPELVHMLAIVRHLIRDVSTGATESDEFSTSKLWLTLKDPFHIHGSEPFENNDRLFKILMCAIFLSVS